MTETIWIDEQLPSVLLPVAKEMEVIPEWELRAAQTKVVFGGPLTMRERVLIDAALSFTILNASQLPA